MENKKKYKKYTLKEKLHKLNLIYINDISQHEVERLYRISRKTQRDWEDQEEEDIREFLNKNKKYRLKGGGKKPETEEIELDLCQFIDISRELGISISANEIIVKVIELMHSLNNKNYSTLCKWCY